MQDQEDAANSATRMLRARLVQHPVDEAMTLFRAEQLGQFHRLVDHDPVGHVRALHQFVTADSQDGAFHRIDLRQRTVQKRLQRGVNFGQSRRDLMHQFAEKIRIGLVQILIGDELRRNHDWGTGRSICHSIERLRGTAPRPTARLPGWFLERVGFSHVQTSSRRNRLTISSTAIAASAPLLPALVPARSTA
jgi:hypothetical protein